MRHSETQVEFEPYYYDLSSGSLLTTENNIQRIELGNSPRNLEQLLSLGRIALLSETFSPSITDEDPQIHKLASLLTYPLPDIKIDAYQHLNTRQWSVEDFKDYGRWLAMLCHQKDKKLNKQVVTRAFRLGIGPSIRSITYGRFSSMSEFYSASGAETAHRVYTIADWSLEDCVDYIREALAPIEKVGKIYAQDYLNEFAQKTKGPTATVLCRHTSLTVRELMDLAGYPNVRKWKEADFVSWGVKFMFANNGTLPTTPALRNLALQGRGPSVKAVQVQFSTIPDFQKKTARRFEEASSEFTERLLQLGSHLSSRCDAEPLLRTATPLPARVRRLAQYYLLETTHVNMQPWLKVIVARIDSAEKFISAIQQHSPSTTKGHMQIAARRIGVFGDIWETDLSYLDYLRVLPKDEDDY